MNCPWVKVFNEYSREIEQEQKHINKFLALFLPVDYLTNLGKIIALNELARRFDEEKLKKRVLNQKKCTSSQDCP